MFKVRTQKRKAPARPRLSFKAWLFRLCLKVAVVVFLLWTVVTLVYLAVSFLTFQWQITWIIFLIGACLEAAINLAFRLGEMK